MYNINDTVKVDYECDRYIGIIREKSKNLSNKTIYIVKIQEGLSKNHNKNLINKKVEVLKREIKPKN